MVGNLGERGGRGEKERTKRDRRDERKTSLPEINWLSLSQVCVNKYCYERSMFHFERRLSYHQFMYAYIYRYMLVL